MVSMPAFEAAETLADASLLTHLLPWPDERSDPPDAIGEAVERAIAQGGGPELPPRL
jgi:hypothetical protein